MNSEPRLHDLKLHYRGQDVYCTDADHKIDMHHGKEGVHIAHFIREGDAEDFTEIVNSLTQSSLYAKFLLLRKELEDVLSFAKEEGSALREQEIDSIEWCLD